jgi:hypothetical protein
VTVGALSVRAELGPFVFSEDLTGSSAFTFAELAPPGTPTGQTVVPIFTYDLPPRDLQGYSPAAVACRPGSRSR